MAVEAKWTEPPYQTVGQWLKASSVPEGKGEDNRREVLSGCIELLQRWATRAISRDELKGLTYQTVHRAASACSLGTLPQLSYLQFMAPSHRDGVTRDKRLADLKILRSVLGSKCENFPFLLVEVDIQFSPEFDKLASLPKGPETASKVGNALISERLFVFKDLRVHQV